MAYEFHLKKKNLKKKPSGVKEQQFIMLTVLGVRNLGREQQEQLIYSTMTDSTG